MTYPTPYDLLERLATLLLAEERRLGGEWALQPVHLRVLRFLGRANRYSDTPAAVAEYLGLGKGTASQSLILLQEKGLVGAHPDAKDGRKRHLSLTALGRKVARRTTPPPLFRDALDRLGEHTEPLGASLLALLKALQDSGGSRAFGVCETCAHCEHSEGERSFRCGLTGERLKLRETQLICREHTDPAPG
ncbi:MAG: transcriptional regulator [Gemmatimonadota bacterium]|nr:MAG: transcriptional regulator [Gemmatimonadota bacterium]